MEEQEPKQYWLSNNRFILIAIILLLMWGGVMLLFYLKADEVTKHPCKVCADKVGEKVTCSSFDGKQMRFFYPDDLDIGEENVRTNVLQQP